MHPVLSALDELPDSVRAQAAETLRRYIVAVKDKSLVVGGDVPTFEALLKNRMPEHWSLAQFGRCDSGNCQNSSR